MFQMPMSSPMITTMLGLLVCAALGTAPPASKKLEMASAPSVSFRTPAPKSMMNLLLHVLLVGLRAGGLRWVNVGPPEVAIDSALEHRINATPILVVCEIYPCSHFNEITNPSRSEERRVGK